MTSTTISTRDDVLDVIRGGAIVSMTAAHLAGGTIVSRALHLPFWMDGAIVFVLMSGLVLGIVQRRALERNSRPAYSKMVRRAGFLYVAQLSILAVAILASVFTGRPDFAPTADEHGGWLPLTFYALTLQLPVPNLTILSMYVVLLLLAVPMAWLCAKRRSAIVLLIALFIWAIATIAPSLTVMPHVSELRVDRFNWGTWLLPFALGFVAGWRWKRLAFPALLRERWVFVGSGILAAMLTLAANAIGRLGLGGTPGAAVAALFEKWDIGIGMIFFGATVIVFSYGLIIRVGNLPVLRNVRRWLAMLGSWSLDCFVILCVWFVLVPVVFEFDDGEPVAIIAAAASLASMTVWAALRQRNRIPFVKKRASAPQPA